jgi:hypothetical protein
MYSATKIQYANILSRIKKINNREYSSLIYSGYEKIK